MDGVSKKGKPRKKPALGAHLELGHGSLGGRGQLGRRCMSVDHDREDLSLEYAFYFR
jgi:hypothetical protein